MGAKLQLQFDGRGLVRAIGILQNRDTVYYVPYKSNMAIPPKFYNCKLELVMFTDFDIAVKPLCLIVESPFRFDHTNQLQLKYISELNDSEGLLIKVDKEHFRARGKLLDEAMKEDI